MPRKEIQKKPEDKLALGTSFLTEIKREYYTSRNDVVKDIVPVSLKKFLYSKEYLNLPFVLSERQYAFLEAMDEDEPRNCKYTEAVLLFGKGAGKDQLVAIFFSRRVYKLLCIDDPQTLFKSQSFELLNIAASEDQAESVFFKYLKNVIKSAGPSAFKTFGFDPDNDIFTSEIRFPKSISCISGHSKAASMEGKNLYCAVLDEVAEFKTDEEVAGKGRHAAMSASTIYRFARTSINTRFPGSGKLILISYPRFQKDFIMTKYESGKDKKNIYVDKAATFEVNPTKFEEDFISDLEDDPENTRTMIYCDPPHAKDAFITQVAFIDRIINDKMKSPYKIGIEGEYKEEFRGSTKDKNQYVISCDLAIKHDVAALAMAHKEYIKERPIYIVDLIRTWKAEPGKVIRLQDVEDAIIILRHRLFNISQVNFDQYASAQMIQRLIEVGFNAKRQSVDLKLDPYLALRNIIYQESLFCYNHPKFIEELKELQLINGIRVDHSSKGSKDISDAICSSIYTLATMPEHSDGANFIY